MKARRVIIGMLVMALCGTLGTVGCQKKSTETSAKSDKTDEESEPTIQWQGKKWEYNKNISNYLFIGVDTREQADTRVGRTDAGQADALFLLSVNRKSGAVTMISIPRDTMTEVESFDLEGNSLGTSTDHISLSYGYGDGGQKSCKLAQEAVENLMYGVPIQGFFALNLDGLPELSKSVGGITVTVPDDSLVNQHPEFTAGTEVTLDESNTEIFVRSRDTETSQSAIARLGRQKIYIRAFVDKAKELYAEDAGYAAKLYQALTPYMVTNISQDRLVKLVQSIDQDKGYEEWTIPGEGVEGESYDEYHVDDDALYEQIIHTFYKEVK